MKRKYLNGLILLLIMSLSLGTFGVFAETTNFFDVEITVVFDGDNIITTNLNLESGSRLSFDNNLPEVAGYTFAYFVINGVVNDELELLNKFTITEDMNAQAVFNSNREYVALFVGSLGEFLNAQVVQESTPAQDPVVDYPFVPGFMLADPLWDNSLNSIIDNTVFVLQYMLDPDNPWVEESATLTITLPGSFDKLYSLNDTWVGPTCTAMDTVSGEIPCLVSGNVDTTEIGAYDVIYYAYGSDDLIKTEVVEYIVFRDTALLEIDYVGYYDGIEGLYGEELLLALRTIINTGITPKSYGDARYILDETDADPLVPGNILTVYTRDSIDGLWDADFNGTWDGIWSREHVWPNSRLGIPSVSNTTIGIGSDLQNLRSIIVSVNSSRSNKIYGPVTTATEYFPGEYDEGDVSRIIFYMAVMYSTLSLLEEIPPDEELTMYTSSSAMMGNLDYLILLNYLDPVDSYEQHRNEIIYDYQKNRNPFIDYSYLIELIWYDQQNILE